MISTIITIGLAVFIGQLLSQKPPSPLEEPEVLAQSAYQPVVQQSSGDPVRDFLDNYTG